MYTQSSVGSSIDSFSFSESNQKGVLRSCLAQAQIDCDIIGDILDLCSQENISVSNIATELKVQNIADYLFLTEVEAQHLKNTCIQFINNGLIQSQISQQYSENKLSLVKENITEENTNNQQSNDQQYIDNGKAQKPLTKQIDQIVTPGIGDEGNKKQEEQVQDHTLNTKDYIGLESFDNDCVDHSNRYAYQNSFNSTLSNINGYRDLKVDDSNRSQRTSQLDSQKVLNQKQRRNNLLLSSSSSEPEQVKDSARLTQISIVSQKIQNTIESDAIVATQMSGTINSLQSVEDSQQQASYSSENPISSAFQVNNKQIKQNPIEPYLLNTTQDVKQDYKNTVTCIKPTDGSSSKELNQTLTLKSQSSLENQQNSYYQKAENLNSVWEKESLWDKESIDETARGNGQQHTRVNNYQVGSQLDKVNSNNQDSLFQIPQAIIDRTQSFNQQQESQKNLENSLQSLLSLEQNNIQPQLLEQNVQLQSQRKFSISPINTEDISKIVSSSKSQKNGKLDQIPKIKLSKEQISRLSSLALNSKSTLPILDSFGQDIWADKNITSGESLIQDVLQSNNNNNIITSNDNILPKSQSGDNTIQQGDSLFNSLNHGPIMQPSGNEYMSKIQKQDNLLDDLIDSDQEADDLLLQPIQKYNSNQLRQASSGTYALFNTMQNISPEIINKQRGNQEANDNNESVYGINNSNTSIQQSKYKIQRYSLSQRRSGNMDSIYDSQQLQSQQDTQYLRLPSQIPTFMNPRKSFQGKQQDNNVDQINVPKNIFQIASETQNKSKENRLEEDLNRKINNQSTQSQKPNLRQNQIQDNTRTPKLSKQISLNSQEFQESPVANQESRKPQYKKQFNSSLQGSLSAKQKNQFNYNSVNGGQQGLSNSNSKLNRLSKEAQQHLFNQSNTSTQYKLNESPSKDNKNKTKVDFIARNKTNLANKSNTNLTNPRNSNAFTNSKSSKENQNISQAKYSRQKGNLSQSADYGSSIKNNQNQKLGQENNTKKQSSKDLDSKLKQLDKNFGSSSKQLSRLNGQRSNLKSSFQSFKETSLQDPGKSKMVSKSVQKEGFRTRIPSTGKSNQEGFKQQSQYIRQPQFKSEHQLDLQKQDNKSNQQQQQSQLQQQLKRQPNGASQQSFEKLQQNNRNSASSQQQLKMINAQRNSKQPSIKQDSQQYNLQQNVKTGK